MLEVQKYLLGSSLYVDTALQSLKDEHGILSKRHDKDSRVILDYDQLKADKHSEIVRECRGLVLDVVDWSLVARGFRRFFNAGESRIDDRKFSWDNKVISTHKEDGSFALLYFYNGQWRMNTRFSFAEHQINDVPMTWSELFNIAAKLDFSTLNTDYTYVFELCSRYNKVVRDYLVPQVYLLTVFYGEMELTYDAYIAESVRINVETPTYSEFSDISEALSYVAKIAEEDKTFEGVVLRDCFNARLKVKSDFYLQLHRLNNNGNISSTKNIVPLIMSGETDEVLVYFPELEDIVKSIDEKIKKIKKEIDNVWFCHHDEISQKRFALAITKDTKYTAPLFSARKLGGHPFDYLTADYITEAIKGIK